VRFGEKSLAHVLVHRPGDHRIEQLPRVGVVQPFDDELGEPFERLLCTGLAHGVDQPKGLGAETARDERQRLRGGPVEPLRVVHDADKRLRLSHRRHQAQDREADEEPVRGVAVAQAERGFERVALGSGQTLEAIRERGAQLLQPRERELHLRLDARRPGHRTSGGAAREIGQQRALSDPGLPTQHQRAARARAHARHQLIQCRALAASTQQPRSRVHSRHRRARG
jgi:hypothetical protein